MNKYVKSIILLLLYELMLFCALMPKTDLFNSIKQPEFLWIPAYMLWGVTLLASISTNKPTVFFTVLAICSATAAVLDKKSLISIPLSVMVWLFLNVAEKQNSRTDLQKKDKKRLVAVNMIFPVVSVLCCVAIVLIHRTSFGISANKVRLYINPYLVFMVYYIYSLVFKSKIPAFIKLKTKLKKLC